MFVYQDAFVVTPIDAKPKSVDDWRALRRVRNVETNGRASVLVDFYDEDWSRIAWVRIDGVADLLTAGPDHRQALAALGRKYAQYRTMPLHDAPVIRVRVEHVAQWQG